jgi:hypothetical protein
MIMVAIIGLVAVLAIGSMVTARKQAQGRRIINDIRETPPSFSGAVDTNKKDGDPIDWTAVSTYLKKPVVLIDLLGDPYDHSTVGNNQVVINWHTKAPLDGVGIDWGPY